jgi:hypothetical protein
MLVEGRWFDGSSSHLTGHRRLQTIAGNGLWIPTFEPRAFPERGAILLLLWALHRHHLCCFLTGTFTMYTAGILHSYASATVFVVLTNALILDLIFQRGPHPPQEFIIQGFKFVFEGAEDDDLDIYFYRVTRGAKFSMQISFFGIDSSTPCGPSSNLNFMHFVWEHSERLSFAKYAILLFPSNCRHPPLMFFKYYRANSDGWTDIEGCGLCIEKYQRSIRSYNDCMRPSTCQCNICTRQPPSLRDSASHILFRCVLDLKRFELTCYTTYNQYKFAVESGHVDDLHLLPPRFSSVEIRFHFKTFEKRFHLHCPGIGEWNTRMEGVFSDMKSAISLLVTNETFYWCRHCDRGLFFPPDCEHHTPDL